MMNTHERAVVVVVDDNLGALYTKRKLLEREGYRILEAATGQEALRIARDALPDLVLLDVNLPDIGGFEVCHQLKTAPETQSIKVLQTSATRIGVLDRVRGLNVGADAYLVEPTEEEELLGTVRALLRLAQHERENRRLIDQLRESEARYKASFHIANVGKMEVDATTGRFLLVNDAYCDIVGWSREELLHMGPADLIYPEDREWDGPTVTAFFRGETDRYSSEKRFVRKDGSVVWVRVNCGLVRDAQGKPLHSVGVLEDVTERKEAEAARRESDRRFEVATMDHYLKRELYDELRSNPTIIEFLEGGSLDGLWYWDIERPDQEWLSPRFWEVLGFDPATKQHVSAEWQDLIFPEDRDRALENFRKHCADPTHPYDQIVRYRHQNGSTVWVRCRGLAVRDKAGKPRRLLGTHTDVTQVMQAEFERAREQQFQEFFTHAAVGAVRLDAQGRFTAVNDRYCEIAGRTREDLLHMTIFDLHDPRDGETNQAFSQFLHGQYEWYEHEEQYVARGEQATWVHVTASLVRNAEHETVSVVLLAQDITKRKQVEEALSASEERFRTSLVESPIPVMLFDDCGQILALSRSWLTSSGYAREELTSIWDWTERAYGDRAADVQAHIRRIIETEPEAIPAELTVRTKEGRSRVWTFIASALGRQSDGRRLFICMAQDITDQREAATVLRDTEERLRLAVESAEIGTWDLNLVTGANRWDRRCKDLFGFSAHAEVSYETFLGMLHSEDRDRVKGVIARSVDPASDGSYDVEYRIVRRDGQERWIKAMGRAYFEERDGMRRAVRFAGTALDMTERHRFEQALHESEERFRSLTFATSHVVWLIGGDGQATPEHDNHSWGTFTGQTPEQRLGRGWIDAIHPDDRAGVAVLWQRAVETGSAYRSEYRLRRRDGEYRWVEAHGVPLLGQDGNVREWVGTSSDITERKQAEEKLRDSESFYRQTLESIPGMTFTTRPDGFCDYQSQQWVDFTGVPMNEHLGDGWNRLLHPDDQPRAFAAWRAAVEGRAPYDLEYRVRRHDGVYEWFKVRARPIRDAEGRIVRWFGTAVNIDELIRAQQALRLSEERFRMLAEAMPHFVWQTDEHGEAEFENQRWYDYTGLTHETTQRGGWLTVQHPDDAPRLAAAWKNAVETGGEYDTETRFRCAADGTYRWFRIKGAPIHDAEGRIRAWVGTCTDIQGRKEAEEALRESEALLKTAIDIAQLSTYEWVPSTGELRWDVRLKAMFGLSPDAEVNYDLWLRAVHPDDRERVVAKVMSAIDPASDGAYEAEYRAVGIHDGIERWIAARGQTFFADGRPSGFIGIAQDITERMQAEAKLIASEGRLKLFIEHAPAAIAMFDRAMRYLAVSRRFMTDYGITSDPIGRSHYEIFPELPERWKEVHRRGLAGEVLQAEADPFERLDGSIQYVKWEVRPWYTENDQIGGLLIAAEEVTAQVKAAETLRESEERFRNIFEHAATGIAIADVDGRFVQCNRSYCAMLGYTEEELHQRNKVFADLVHPDDRTANMAQIQRLLKGDLSFFEIENRDVHKQGEPVWVHKFVSLLRDQAGKPKYLVALVTNVTERRKAERALHDAQARLQRWNHELEEAVTLKTTELHQSQDRLRALATELNLAEQRERKRLATELHDHLQQMLVVGKLAIGQGKRAAIGIPACETALKRVDDVLSDALTYSRTLVAELSPPVLHEHGLGAGLRWLGDYMKKHGLTVTVMVPEGEGRQLPEDQRVMLFQSVRELLINTSKHAGTGTATVEMTERADQVQIQVRDDGRGFDLAAAAAAAGTPSGGISSKFGLFSIQERMRALGGTFEIQSGLGQGTTATLSLPLARTAETNVLSPELSGTAGSAPSSQHPILQKNAKIRVLLVDDHIMVRQGLRAVLDAYVDIELVGEAGDGEAAVHLVEQCRPDVVVMDISMPKMNGIDATMQIKLRYPETIMIGLSVNANDENQEAMTRAGAVRLMTKESAVEQLYDAIQKAIRTRASRQVEML